MAKTIIVGSSYCIKSTISMETLALVKKYQPSALTLVDAETGEVTFKLGTGANSLSEYGISFGGVSNDDEKLATATLQIPQDVEDAKAYVLDKAGLALVSLEKIEGNIAEVLEEIRNQRESIASSIEVQV